MKTHFFVPRRSESGFAVLVVMGLLFLMLIMILAANQSLYRLHREIRLVEQNQQKKFDQGTNAPVFHANP